MFLMVLQRLNNIIIKSLVLPNLIELSVLMKGQIEKFRFSPPISFKILALLSALGCCQHLLRQRMTPHAVILFYLFFMMLITVTVLSSLKLMSLSVIIFTSLLLLATRRM